MSLGTRFGVGVWDRLSQNPGSGPGTDLGKIRDRVPRVGPRAVTTADPDIDRRRSIKYKINTKHKIPRQKNLKEKKSVSEKECSAAEVARFEVKA